MIAHENTGSLIQTMDDDLLDFLAKFLAKESEFVLYIEADHGMRYGDWFTLIEGAMEHRLPALFIFVSTSLLERVQNGIDNLDYNSYRLVSKFDLRVTDLHLSRLPYYS